MSDEQLAKILLYKLTQRDDYFAWYLSQYQRIENASQAVVAQFLQATPSQWETLSMCKVPDSREPDFLMRLKSIAQFADVNLFTLAKLIRSVEADIALQREVKSESAALIAAREKPGQAPFFDKEK